MEKVTENMPNPHENATPENWDNSIHQIFLKGNIHKAIENTVNGLNAATDKKPKGLLIQLSYYLFLLKDYTGASHILKSAHKLYPEDDKLLLNLGISLSRNQKYKESIHYISQYLKNNKKDFTGWDSLASSYYHLSNYDKSTKAGNNSLLLKDRLYSEPDNTWLLPKTPISELTKNKKKVIAFSLWGNEKRYIFGALRNLLLAYDLYPDWELWFYTDSSVSSGFHDVIKQLGGKIILQTENQSQREKLCWRFAVANDDTVGYFLVRDVDSVFSIRECNAVQEWLNSDKHFHIIRDWWTHTDLILAGLWGGVAGILPNMKTLLNNYSPNSVTTSNIDQWFLRDCIWRYIKTSSLIHDRCFSDGRSLPVPGPLPEGNFHIGSCEFHQRPEFQEKILAAWLDRGRKA
jgi:tetratricopeptide (TPR) repeat protein